eukprot:TRINITY_DN11924_c0_g1_i1.p1 TRINITY_DN11924_c0_g1~~TRINITY_DN11924_c0_g1_i1.p1  ORF type:complete len:207 (+),score=73.08 TRINITY_DN11924_c0_g1_i1:105-725(+)
MKIMKNEFYKNSALSKSLPSIPIVKANSCNPKDSSKDPSKEKHSSSSFFSRFNSKDSLREPKEKQVTEKKRSSSVLTSIFRHKKTKNSEEWRRNSSEDSSPNFSSSSSESVPNYNRENSMDNFVDERSDNIVDDRIDSISYEKEIVSNEVELLLNSAEFLSIAWAIFWIFVAIVVAFVEVQNVSTPAFVVVGSKISGMMSRVITST